MGVSPRFSPHLSPTSLPDRRYPSPFFTGPASKDLRVISNWRMRMPSAKICAMICAWAGSAPAMRGQVEDDAARFAAGDQEGLIVARVDGDGAGIVAHVGVETIDLRSLVGGGFVRIVGAPGDLSDILPWDIHAHQHIRSPSPSLHFARRHTARTAGGHRRTARPAACNSQVKTSAGSLCRRRTSSTS